MRGTIVSGANVSFYEDKKERWVNGATNEEVSFEQVVKMVGDKVIVWADIGSRTIEYREVKVNRADIIGIQWVPLKTKGLPLI